MYFPHPEWQVGVEVAVVSFTVYGANETRTNFRAYAFNGKLAKEEQYINGTSRSSLELAVALCIAERTPVSKEVTVNPRAEKFALEVRA
jgi:hypothetical protein